MFAQSDGPAGSLAVTLASPTTVGNAVQVYLRFSPLTGTPTLMDSFGNPYTRTAIFTLVDGEAMGFWLADIVRGGAYHTLTISSQGGSQNLECAFSELATAGHGEQHSEREILLAILGESSQQTALLQRLVTAERA
jgi:hypothetical protein